MDEVAEDEDSTEIWMYFWFPIFFFLYLFLNWIRRHIYVTNLTKKHVLITGCDSGFGHILAQRLDLLGIPVFAACSTESAQRRLKEVASNRLQTLTLDVTDAQQTKDAVEFVQKHLNPDQELWGVVNNAIHLGEKLGPLEWNSTDDFHAVYNTNVAGTVQITLAFLPLLKRSKGRIVNIAHVCGRTPLSYNVPYSLSCSAVEAFTDSIRAHLSQFGVGVHLIEIGAYQTNLIGQEQLLRCVQRSWDNLSMNTKEEYGRDYLEELQNLCLDLVKNTSYNDVNSVINAYTNCLITKYPRLRYSVGWDTSLLHVPLSYMPSVIQDWILGWTTSKLVPAACRNLP